MRERTSLPSGLATAATWNPRLAYQGGAMIGAEARESGFNVMLAGGVNLLREPRNGRNFEYGGEDPLLAGQMVGAEIQGIQSNHIISTIKHYALNNQETGRFTGNVQIAEDQARMSDLLAFQMAMEISSPGSVMCSYNKVNGDWACENDALLQKILKKDWGFKGFVMSDWGAVHSTAKAVNAGLDQESGAQFDEHPYFEQPLKQALQSGEVSAARLDDMVGRILYAMFAQGVVDHPVAAKPIDYAAHALVTRADEEEAIVLLKNDKAVLPLSSSLSRLAVIGGHSDVGVLAGSGSSLVYPIGGNAVPGIAPTSWPGPVMYHPSSPVTALKAQLPKTRIDYLDGSDPQAAAKLAAASEIALVFVTQWTGEDWDAPLDLLDQQSELVAAVAAANPRTIVVVESGGPVLMPWANKVAGLVEAWYPGTNGGEAIARVLTGAVDASGRLPMTVPQSLDQLPHPRLEGPKNQARIPFDLPYDEGATVGYKWYDAKGLDPAFPFGFGLSYTSFDHDGLVADLKDNWLTVRFTVRNVGKRSGKDVPQIYVGSKGAGWEAPRRLAGFRKLELQPGESKSVSLTIDPRLLAVYKDGQWKISAGDYTLSLASSSRSLQESVTVTLPERSFR
jgi:beta-glucosidase